MDKVSVTAWKCTHNKLERELKEDDNDENIDDDGYLLLAFRVPENVPALQIKLFIYHPHHSSVQWTLSLLL